MSVRKKVEQAEPMDLDKLAKALNKSADDAGKALPADERAAYEAARDSVEPAAVHAAPATTVGSEDDDRTV